MFPVRRALVSVTDKSGLVNFAKGLSELKVRMLSTGGTARTLREVGIAIAEVSDYTGFPEMLDGRVKTLNPAHAQKMQEYGIRGIDMVVINLYPFEATIAKPNCTLEDAIENIDIGGPSMLRAGAKNYPYVSVIVDPADYKPILAEMKKTGGSFSKETNFQLAKKVYALTARYDRMIADYLAKK